MLDVCKIYVLLLYNIIYVLLFIYIISRIYNWTNAKQLTARCRGCWSISIKLWSFSTWLLSWMLLTEWCTLHFYITVKITIAKRLIHVFPSCTLSQMQQSSEYVECKKVGRYIPSKLFYVVAKKCWALNFAAQQLRQWS